MNEQVCEWLRHPPPGEIPSADVLSSARAEGVHLVIGDRFAVPELVAELRHAAVVEEIRGLELRAVLTALAGRGVPSVLLKGAALARTHYAKPELRVRSDTDVMIPERTRDTAAAALGGAGYERVDEVDGDAAVGQFHFVRTDAHGVYHQLDVHWRVSNARVFADVLTFDELRANAVAIPALGPDAVGPSAVHALLIACVHRVAHHDDTHNLLWLLDVHLLASGLSDRERSEFVRLAVERKMHAVCAATLDLAQRAFGALGPAWTDALAQTAKQDEPSRAFLGGGLRPADILLSDVAATPAWTAKLRLLTQHVLPRASYMRARYPRWPAALLPAAYAYRVVSGLPRWFRRTSYRASGG